MAASIGRLMDFITQYWPQIAALIGLVIWTVRLEGLVKFAIREIKRLDVQRDGDLKSAEKAREATNSKLDRMDDKIERAFKEVRDDIKTLIRQGSPQGGQQ